MKKAVKVFVIMLVFAFCFGNLTAYAATDIPAATKEFYVNDFAGIFSEDQKSQLMKNAVDLANEHDGIQVVVSTVASLDGDTVENYALKMYNQYGIGKDDMGLLILLSTGDRKIRVEVGKSMEAYVNDAKAGRFIDNYAISYLKENKFNEGLVNLQAKLIEEIKSSIQKEKAAKDNAPVTENSKSDNSFNFLPFLFILLIFAAVACLVYLVIITVRKRANKIKRFESTIRSLEERLENIKQLDDFNLKKAQKQAGIFQNEINKISGEKDILTRKYETTKEELNVLKDRYNRAIILSPNIDKQVTAMIEDEIYQKDLAIAKEMDNSISKVINLQASKDIVSKLESVISSYSNLSNKQKSYTTSDINKLKMLYDASCKLKLEYEKKQEEEKNIKLADVALASILGIISYISIGRSSDLRSLENAKSIYNNLSFSAREYFDQSVVHKLDKLLDEAKRDKEEEEEEERLKRQRQDEEDERRRQSNNSSNDDNSSSFGGFGGSSGGGGASRDF